LGRIALEDDLEAIQEYFYAQGLTDGHPILPPTPERVAAFLAAAGRDAQEEIAVLPPAFRVATVEKIAVNAVMAWCKPEYMPLLLAAVEAMAGPAFNLYGLQATTHPSGTPLLIVNGPVRHDLGINCAQGCFGHGTRANATIGRAIRLILTNIGGAYPGTSDMSTHGWPGKYGFCFGENEELSPWEPLHVERGFAPEDSTVTLVGTGGTYNFGDLWSTMAEGVLASAASAMSAYGTNNLGMGGQPALVLCPEHAAVLGEEGLSKAETKAALFERCGSPLGRLAPELRQSRLRRHPADTPESLLKPIERPEDLILLVAGGAGPHSVFIPTFGPDTWSVTTKIRRTARPSEPRP